MQLAQAVNCTGPDAPCGQCNACTRISRGLHADVRVISLEGADDESRTLIGIESIRDLHEVAHLKPYEGRCHVFIIEDADRLSAEAANALLKLLEEPPPDVLLLLLTANPDAILPTVASRAQILELRPLPLREVSELLRADYGATEEQAENVAVLSRGCVGWAIDAVQSPAVLADLHQRLERIADVSRSGLEARFTYADDLARRFQRDRALGREELYVWMRWWRDIMLLQQGRAEEVVHRNWRETLEAQAQALSARETVCWIGRLYETLGGLERNANPRLALEVLMLDLPRGAVGKSSSSV
jgi:DNA polymerase-3 subunit delta'